MRSHTMLLIGEAAAASDRIACTAKGSAYKDMHLGNRSFQTVIFSWTKNTPNAIKQRSHTLVQPCCYMSGAESCYFAGVL